jgi:hypothetical protein
MERILDCSARFAHVLRAVQSRSSALPLVPLAPSALPHPRPEQRLVGPVGGEFAGVDVPHGIVAGRWEVDD